MGKRDLPFRCRLHHWDVRVCNIVPLVEPEAPAGSPGVGNAKQRMRAVR